jgi:hypothetical protein
VRTDHPATDDRWQATSSAVVLDGDGRLRVETVPARRGGVA